MRLVIVSNRLPVTVVMHGGNVELREAVGGLATAIKSFLRASEGGRWDSPRCCGWGGPA